MPESAFTMLEAAITANDAERVQAVLEQHPGLRASLDEALPSGAFGATPLLAAVYEKNRDMIEALLQAGADINARSHWWAGSFGVLDNDSGLEEFLIARGARVDAHAAARLGRLDRLEELLASNPGLVHARGGDGQTPLHFAANIQVADFLLAHGAVIDAEDIDHESTPAQWMVRERQAVARYLVGRGCRTDILMAAALGDLELVRHHLEADPGCIRMSVSEAWFPKRNPRSGGTIYNWTLDSDKTAHLIARAFGHEDVLAFLMARSPDELKLALACELEDEGLLADLLSRRPNLVEQLSPAELDKLPDAARDSNRNAVRMMLAAGWPVDRRGHHHGETALHWAAFHGNAAMVRDILLHGPDLTLRSLAYAGTALEWAMYGSVHGWHPERGDYGGVVQALLEAGATRPRVTDSLIASASVRAALTDSGGAG